MACVGIGLTRNKHINHLLDLNQLDCMLVRDTWNKMMFVVFDAVEFKWRTFMMRNACHPLQHAMKPDVICRNEISAVSDWGIRENS